MTSRISHSGAPGWITARTLQCLSDIGRVSSSHCLEVEVEVDWIGVEWSGVVFIIIVITDWQQTVCLFSYYPI